MKQELEQRIYQRWPKWFHPDGNIQETLIPFGLECGDGWFDLIWKLCEDIEKLGVPETFQVVQVKEKFAELRFYYAGGVSDEVNKRITLAEDQSGQTCEVCGQPGEVRGGSWLKALCDEHAGDKKTVGRITSAQELAEAILRPENQEVLDRAAAVIKKEKDQE